MAFLSLSTIMDVYFYRLGIFFQSIFDVNSQVTWDTNYVGHETGNINLIFNFYLKNRTDLRTAVKDSGNDIDRFSFHNSDLDYISHQEQFLLLFL